MFVPSIFGRPTVGINAQYPMSQVVEAQQKVGEGIVELFELRLVPTGVIYFKNNDTVTWQGNKYEGLALALTGVDQHADGTDSRPKFQCVNPEGLFTPFVVGGNLEKAHIIRKRVLRPHVDRNARIFQQRSWYVSRVANVDDQSIQLELREISDGPNFLIPARMYKPPEFPVVTLQ